MADKSVSLSIAPLLLLKCGSPCYHMKGAGQACVTRTMSDKTSFHAVGVGPEINTLLTREKLIIMIVGSMIRRNYRIIIEQIPMPC